MKSNHSCCVLILFSLLLPSILDSAHSPLTLSNCPNQCGELQPPYPFGLKEGCYLHKGYKVDCQYVSGEYVPFLSANKKEIISITLPSDSDSKGSLVIKSPITTSSKEVFGSLLNLTGLKQTQWFQEKPYGVFNLEWSFPISVITTLGCGNESVSCICKNTTESYANCACALGYEGNPYLLDGCTDIDECEFMDDDESGNYCQGSECVNIVGSYYCKHKVSIRDINTVGILLIVGSCLLVLVGVGALYILIRRGMRIKRQKKFFKRNGGLLLQQQLTTTQGNVETTRVFSSKELSKATGNFRESRVLGKGGQGTVYKGMLIDGTIVAVKKATVVDANKIGQFINEMVILSQINHRNIVKLIGCCLESEVPLLVYEYISNGNLYEHLHAQVSNQRMATWEVRLRIAIEIAEALSYLHSAASIPIYHRDVKTTNIMLDNKHRAKVSDFGTSRSVTEDHTHLTTRVVSGSAGYLDPEYYQSSQYTERSDVYSYGVVLVELITGEQPVSSTRPTQFRTLATYFNHIIKEDKVVDAIDARIKNECKLEEVMAVAQVARKCLNLKRRKRPDMKQVTMELKKIRCSPEDMLTHVDLSDDEEEKRNLEAFVGIEGTNNVAVTAPVPSQHNVASSSYSSRWSDTEPMCPLRTQNTF